jgi:hypothetical protein
MKAMLNEFHEPGKRQCAASVRCMPLDRRTDKNKTLEKPTQFNQEGKKKTKDEPIEERKKHYEKSPLRNPCRP